MYLQVIYLKVQKSCNIFLPELLHRPVLTNNYLSYDEMYSQFKDKGQIDDVYCRILSNDNIVMNNAIRFRILKISKIYQM